MPSASCSSACPRRCCSRPAPRRRGRAAPRGGATHGWPPPAIPPVPRPGLELGRLLGGAVTTETIFAGPGLGRLPGQALLTRDFPVVPPAVFVIWATYTVI